MRGADFAQQSTLNPESYLNSLFHADGTAKTTRALSNDNIFSSSKGLPYLSSDMAYNYEETNGGNLDNDEMEMHITDDL